MPSKQEPILREFHEREFPGLTWEEFLRYMKAVEKEWLGLLATLPR